MFNRLVAILGTGLLLYMFFVLTAIVFDMFNESFLYGITVGAIISYAMTTISDIFKKN